MTASATPENYTTLTDVTAYGFLEIIVGIYIIIGTMTRKPELVEPDLLLVQLAGGMYVIIRGFDNFAQSAPFARRRRGV